MLAFFVVLAISTGSYGSACGKPKEVRPCALTDYRCMGRHLAAQSKCNPVVRGCVPQEYVVPKFFFELPNFNASVYDDNVVVRGAHLCTINEFKYVSNVDQTVIGIFCPGVQIEADRRERYYYDRQPTVDVKYHISLDYPYYYNTIVLSPENNKTICGTTSFTNMGNPKFTFSTPIRMDTGKPELVTDRILQSALSQLGVYEKEKWRYGSQAINTFIINSLICKYPCNFNEIY